MWPIHNESAVARVEHTHPSNIQGKETRTQGRGRREGQEEGRGESLDLLCVRAMIQAGVRADTREKWSLAAAAVRPKAPTTKYYARTWNGGRRLQAIIASPKRASS